ncbi:hypothetical protein EVAR_68174_1 [Eumeta japonica]|uniref:Uncharacterized protein n=1 Tax=Eumeta variegata TaxID=151549 RepID=A0A4C1ZXC6_EUMVA|nr:hypothetical protein EVAR_68174_1 [Eumeta japonica]
MQTTVSIECLKSARAAPLGRGPRALLAFSVVDNRASRTRHLPKRLRRCLHEHCSILFTVRYVNASSHNRRWRRAMPSRQRSASRHLAAARDNLLRFLKAITSGRELRVNDPSLSGDTGPRAISMNLNANITAERYSPSAETKRVHYEDKSK